MTKKIKACCNAYEQVKKDTIERAIKWIKEHGDSYTWYNEMEGESGITNDFEDAFRKAMEED